MSNNTVVTAVRYRTAQLFVYFVNRGIRGLSRWTARWWAAACARYSATPATTAAQPRRRRPRRPARAPTPPAQASGSVFIYDTAAAAALPRLLNGQSRRMGCGAPLLLQCGTTTILTSHIECNNKVSYRTIFRKMQCYFWHLAYLVMGFFVLT